MLALEAVLQKLLELAVDRSVLLIAGRSKEKLLLSSSRDLCNSGSCLALRILKAALKGFLVSAGGCNHTPF